MAGMNFSHGDALALTTHIVNFQDVEADTRTNWADDIAFFAVLSARAKMPGSS